MKIQYLSDLHLEFDSKRKVQVHPEADVIVLAGDIHVKPTSLHKFFRKLRLQKDISTIYILGNHEYYGHSFAPETVEEYRKACVDSGVILLDNQDVFIDDVRFIGSTLYSDISRPESAFHVERLLTDFRVVDGMSLNTWQDRFNRDRKYLVDALEVNMSYSTVVVTHFCPLWMPDVIDPQFSGQMSNAGFHSDLHRVIEQYQPELWIYGHTHYNSPDVSIGRTRVVCNQFGYPHEAMTTPYKDIAIVTCSKELLGLNNQCCSYLLKRNFGCAPP